MKYEEPQMKVVMLPEAEVFTLSGDGTGDDIINKGNGTEAKGNWL